MKQKTQLIVACITSLLFVALLQGCGTTGTKKSELPLKAYSGSIQPGSNLAVVECGFGAKVKSVDGNHNYTCDPLKGKLSLLPGKHTFEVWMELQVSGGKWDSQQSKNITFSVDAMHNYSITALRDEEDKYKSDGWTVSVIDRNDTTNGWVIHPDKRFMRK